MYSTIWAINISLISIFMFPTQWGTNVYPGVR